MYTPRISLLGLLAFVGLGSLASVQAATTPILSDNFESYTSLADLTTGGYYFRNTAGTGTVWSAPATLNETPLSGTTLVHGGGSQGNTWLLKQFSTTTLSSLNDSITFSFDAKMATTSNEFHVDLLNASQTLTANALGGTSPYNGATGYGYVQTATSYGVASIAATSSNDTNTFLESLSTAPTVTGSALSFSLVITKVATGAQVQFYQGTNLLSSAIDTSNTGSLTFNTIKLRTFNTSNIDNFSLTFSSVPEPATASMLAGLGALGAVALRRRRRA